MKKQPINSAHAGRAPRNETDLHKPKEFGTRVEPHMAEIHARSGRSLQLGQGAHTAMNIMPEGLTPAPPAFGGINCWTCEGIKATDPWFSKQVAIVLCFPSLPFHELSLRRVKAPSQIEAFDCVPVLAAPLMGNRRKHITSTWAPNSMLMQKAVELRPCIRRLISVNR